MSAKVYDFRSRKPIQQEKPIVKVPEGGRYIGHIHPSEADVVRDAYEAMEVTGEMVDDLVDQWQDLVAKYYGQVELILRIFKIPDFNPESDEMHVGEDGHCWIIPKGENEYEGH